MGVGHGTLDRAVGHIDGAVNGLDAAVAQDSAAGHGDGALAGLDADTLGLIALGGQGVLHTAAADSHTAAGGLHRGRGLGIALDGAAGAGDLQGDALAHQDHAAGHGVTGLDGVAVQIQHGSAGGADGSRQGDVLLQGDGLVVRRSSQGLAQVIVVDAVHFGQGLGVLRSQGADDELAGVRVALDAAGSHVGRYIGIEGAAGDLGVAGDLAGAQGLARRAAGESAVGDVSGSLGADAAVAAGIVVAYQGRITIDCGVSTAVDVGFNLVLLTSDVECVERIGSGSAFIMLTANGLVSTAVHHRVAVVDGQGALDAGDVGVADVQRAGADDAVGVAFLAGIIDGLVAGSGGESAAMDGQVAFALDGNGGTGEIAAVDGGSCAGTHIDARGITHDAALEVAVFNGQGTVVVDGSVTAVDGSGSIDGALTLDRQGAVVDDGTALKIRGNGDGMASHIQGQGLARGNGGNAVVGHGEIRRQGDGAAVGGLIDCLGQGGIFRRAVGADRLALLLVRKQRNAVCGRRLLRRVRLGGDAGDGAVGSRFLRSVLRGLRLGLLFLDDHIAGGFGIILCNIRHRYRCRFGGCCIPFRKGGGHGGGQHADRQQPGQQTFLHVVSSQFSRFCDLCKCVTTQCLP